MKYGVCVDLTYYYSVVGSEPVFGHELIRDSRSKENIGYGKSSILDIDKPENINVDLVESKRKLLAMTHNVPESQINFISRFDYEAIERENKLKEELELKAKCPLMFNPNDIRMWFSEQSIMDQQRILAIGNMMAEKENSEEKD